MGQQAPPQWVGQTIEGAGVLLGVYAAARGVIAGIQRWLRRRERRRELDAARDQALRVLLDGAREALRDDGGDEYELRERVARRRTLYDSARDRLWLAQGRTRSAALPPDAAASEDDTE